MNERRKTKRLPAKKRNGKMQRRKTKRIGERFEKGHPKAKKEVSSSHLNNHKKNQLLLSDRVNKRAK